MNVVGWALAIAGIAMLLWSLILTIRVNKTNPIPYWRNPAVVAPGSIVLRSVGAALLVFGAVTLTSSPNYWSVGLVLLALLPALIMTPAHNRRVDRK